MLVTALLVSFRLESKVGNYGLIRFSRLKSERTTKLTAFSLPLVRDVNKMHFEEQWAICTARLPRVSTATVVWG